jgi:toxin ParE1/3/4
LTHTARVLRRAEWDLQGFRDYIRRDAPEARDRILVELLDAIGSLNELPDRGPQPRDLRLRRLDYRFVVVGRYLIFYKVLGSEVRVFRVLHGKRAYQDLLR